MLKIPTDIWLHHLLPRMSYSNIRNLALTGSQLHKVCNTDAFWQNLYQTTYSGHMVRFPFESWNQFYGRVYIRTQEKFPNHPPLPVGFTWNQFSNILGTSLQIPVYYPSTNQISSIQRYISKVYVIPNVTTFESLFEQVNQIVIQYPELKHFNNFKFSLFHTFRKDITFVNKLGCPSIQFERRQIKSRHEKGTYGLKRERYYENNPLDIIVYLLRRFNQKEVGYIELYDFSCTDPVDIPEHMLEQIILPVQRLTKKEKKNDKKRAIHSVIVGDHIQSVMSSGFY